MIFTLFGAMPISINPFGIFGTLARLAFLIYCNGIMESFCFSLWISFKFRCLTLIRWFVAVLHWQITLIQKHFGITIGLGPTHWTVVFWTFSRARLCIVFRCCTALDDRNDSYRAEELLKIQKSKASKDHAVRGHWMLKKKRITKCEN